MNRESRFSGAAARLARRTLRVSFSYLAEDRIPEAVGRLRDAVGEAVREFAGETVFACSS